MELVFVCPLHSVHQDLANEFFSGWRSHFEDKNYEIHLLESAFLNADESFKRSATFLQKNFRRKKEDLNFSSSSTFFFVVGEHPMLVTEDGLILEFDFENSPMHFRPQVQRKSDLLLKASGVLDKKEVKIADLTAGTLADSFLMAQFGAQVTAWERSAVLFPLLDQALKKEQQRQASWDQDQQFAKNISLNFADAKQLLNQKELLASIDTFVFDPMFPEAKKKALPRKEMQVFRQIVGPDKDTQEMVTIFGQNLTAKQRLIVKRPWDAPALGVQMDYGMTPWGPQRSVQGSLVRWDIYEGRK